MSHTLLAIRIIYHTSRIIIKTTPVPRNVSGKDAWELIQKMLDISIGLLTIYIIKLKWDQNTKTDAEIKDLIQKLERKDIKINRLTHRRGKSVMRGLAQKTSRGTFARSSY